MKQIKETKFTINNHKWKIKIKPSDELLTEFKKQYEDAYYCFGFTSRQYNEIYINEDMCYEEQIRTLKHELTHCFIWEYGYSYADFNNEEMVCEFVASINDFINDVIEKVKR